MSRRLFYCDHHEFPLPAGHKFPARKYRLLREMLAAGGDYTLEPAPLADAEAVSLAHEPSYVHRFLRGELDPSAMRRIGFPWSEELARRTLASVGGTLAASEEALRSGFGGNLAGGTHHAFRAEGSGFCVFNDFAVAILSLRKDERAARAAVLDLDVHQGDGTAQIFENDPRVLTVSVHAGNNFPFRKQRSRVDVELPDNTGDEAFLDVVREVLRSVLTFGPDILFYQSGGDGLAEDRLGRLALTRDGLADRDRLVFEAVRKSGIPLVITLGGGYADPIELTVQAHANTFTTAARILGP